MASRVSKINNVLKALVGTNWGQQKETLLLTYKELGRSIANYAAPVWSTNASDTSLEKIQRIQNEALRIITGSYKMSSIEYLHSETKMLLVKDHLNLLSAQYLVHCLDTENVCHHITTMDHPPRKIKETLFTRHNQTVLPLLANTKKASLQAVHTSFVNSNRQHDGQQSIKLSTTTYQWQGNLSDETTTGHFLTAPLRPPQALELLQKETEAD